MIPDSQRQVIQKYSQNSLGVLPTLLQDGQKETTMEKNSTDLSDMVKSQLGKKSHDGTQGILKGASPIREVFREN